MLARICCEIAADQTNVTEESEPEKEQVKHLEFRKSDNIRLKRRQQETMMITTTTAPIHHGNDYHIDPSLLPFKKRRHLYDHYHEKEGDDRQKVIQSNKSSGNGYHTDPSLLPLKKRHRFYDHHHEKGDDHSQEVIQSNKSSSTTTVNVYHQSGDSEPRSDVAA